jgi:type IV pilus assembly protein PilW
MTSHELSSYPPARFAMRGFSLVELMVAMALSVVLLGGVLAIFASSRTTYETNDRLSRIQETGRFALDSITRDLRAAGYIGCSQRASLVNTLNNSNTLLWNFAVPMQGFDGQDGVWLPALDVSELKDPDADSDAIVVRIPKHDVTGARMVKDMTSTTGDLEIDAASAATILKGDIVMISDCAGRAVFEVSAKAGTVLSHEQSDPAEEEEGEPGSEPEVVNTPGNASNDLKQAYTANSEVTPLQTVVYYIGEGSTAGAGTSLWRRVSGNPAAEELVEGVESMQLQFGERFGANITYKLRADQVTNWNNVVAVTVALLVRSLSEYGVDVDATAYTLLDEVIAAPNDRHMRQVFTTTATLRNQTL